MLNEKSLTLEEVKEVAATQNKIKQQYYEEVVSQLEKFDNEIYRIRKGKISYQPKLVANLLVIAKELGNEVLIAHLKTVVDVECALEVNLRVIVEKMDAKSYHCTLSSDLPNLTPLKGYVVDEDFEIHFEEVQFRNKKYTKGNLQNTIKEKLANQLNREKEISLYDTVNKNNLIDAHTELTNKLASYNMKSLFSVNSLLISVRSCEIKLRVLTSIITDTEIVSTYMDYITYNSNTSEKINTTYATNLASYLKTNEQMLAKKKADGDNKVIQLIKNYIETNKNSLRTNVKLASTNSEEDNPTTLCGTIQITISNQYLISITLGKNDISYAIQEVYDNGYVFSTIFDEQYVYNHKSAEKLYEEILIIYEKAKILVEL